MDSEQKKEYIAIGLKRTKERKEVRKDKRALKYRLYGRGTAKCSECGGAMTWCSTCEVWSRNCCVDWGTCLCS